MITRLPHWNITNMHPAFNDLESKTAVEMVSRIYGKMQELIESYNQYVDEINKEIDDFENGITTDFDTFKTHIDTIMHNYISMIDEKILIQDKTIEESIIYIKNNISDSIIQIINEMKESGELDIAIDETLEQYNARITEMEETIDEQNAKIDEQNAKIDDSISQGSKTYDNVNELKNTDLTSGVITLLGYYTKHDNIPILYEILDTGISDDGSVIPLANGKYAHAILNDGVTPETFGISETNTKEESISKWTTYINFVNSNRNLYFKLLGKTYTIYKTINVGANFIGLGRNRTIIKAGDTFDVTTVTLDGKTMSKSTMLYFSNNNVIAQQTKTFGFTLDCDNKVDCGIFLSDGAYWNTENVEILNSIYAGLFIGTAWQCSWKMMTIDHTQGIGVLTGQFGNLGLTTQTFENVACQGHDTAVRGWYGCKLYYSRFIDCSSDNYSVNGYRFDGCKNISGNIGCEYINGTNTIYFENCNFDLNIYATQAKPTESLIMLGLSNSGRLHVYEVNSTIPKLIKMGSGTNTIDLLHEGNTINNNILSGDTSTKIVILKKSGGLYKAKNSLTFTEM